MLFFSPSDCIMMLHHTDRLLEEVKSLFTPLSEDTKLAERLEHDLGLPDHPLGGRPGGEVAAPVGVWVTGVWEEVILFGRPLDPGVMQRLEIARGGRVEYVDCLVCQWKVVDHLVQVHKPGVGRLVVKVHAHSEHYVVCFVHTGLNPYVI